MGPRPAAPWVRRANDVEKTDRVPTAPPDGQNIGPTALSSAPTASSEQPVPRARTRIPVIWPVLGGVPPVRTMTAQADSWIFAVAPSIRRHFGQLLDFVGTVQRDVWGSRRKVERRCVIALGGMAASGRVPEIGIP